MSEGCLEGRGKGLFGNHPSWSQCVNCLFSSFWSSEDFLRPEVTTKRQRNPYALPVSAATTARPVSHTWAWEGRNQCAVSLLFLIHPCPEIPTSAEVAWVPLSTQRSSTSQWRSKVEIGRWRNGAVHISGGRRHTYSLICGRSVVRHRKETGKKPETEPRPPFSFGWGPAAGPFTAFQTRWN